MGGERGRSSKLKKVSKKIVATAYACASFSSSKSLSVSDSSDWSITKPNCISEEIKEVEIAEQIEHTTNNNSLPTKNLCAICLDPLNCKSKGSSPGQAIFTAQCSHSFHFTCISSNVRHGSITCPICRAQWTQLPRNLNPPSNQTDPILRILDHSIATLRGHRRSFLRSARYDDDDPIEPDLTPTQSRLTFSLITIPRLALHSFYPQLQVSGCTPHYPFPYQAPLHHHFGYSGSSSLLQSSNGQASYNSMCNSKTRACLSVKLGHQKATDLVLITCPNGPHLRLLKQAMALVVFSLRPTDRLAVVTYSSAAARVFPLRRMTACGKRAALQVIDRLFYIGQADLLEGIKKASKILEDRVHKNPQSSILHLSDGPTRSCRPIDSEISIPVHRFHVGFGSGTSNGVVMNEFEEFLAKLLGGVIRDIQLRIGEEPGSKIARLGDLRGGEEKRIMLELNDCRHVSVRYSYVEGEVVECISRGETLVSLGEDKSNVELEGDDGRKVSVCGRSSSVESWDYHDPIMARRWAKHLHGYSL